MGVPVVKCISIYLSPNKVIPSPKVMTPEKLRRNFLGEHRLVQFFSNVLWQKFTEKFLHKGWRICHTRMCPPHTQPFSQLYHGRHKGQLWHIKWQQITITMMTITVVVIVDFLNLCSILLCLISYAQAICYQLFLCQFAIDGESKPTKQLKSHLKLELSTENKDLKISSVNISNLASEPPRCPYVICFGYLLIVIAF